MAAAAAPSIHFTHATRREVRTQFGALPWRVKGDKVQVMLVTSRNTGRWIVPKGWPMPGKSPAKAAAVEAFEEAGVTGKVENAPLGIYSYVKQDVPEDGDLPCMVTLFPLKVKKKHGAYPEKRQRKRKWMSPKKAARLVREPELKAILKSFQPN